MKTLILLLLVTLSVTAQTTERKELYNSNKGYSFETSTTNKVTTKYFAYSFRNMQYQHIKDYGFIILYKKEDVQVFADKLLEFAGKESKSEVTFEADKYALALFNFSNNIYISDSEKKIFALSKKEAVKIANDILSRLELIE